MIRWTRRSAASPRSALTVLAVAGGLTLAGCAAGQQAQTAQQRPTVDGINAQIGDIVLRDVALAYPDDGLYEKGSTARLRMIVVNQGNESDQLVEVRSDSAQSVSISGASTPGATVSAQPSGSESGAAPTNTPSGTASGTPTATKEPPNSTVTAGSGSPSAGETGSPVATSTEGGATPSATPSATQAAAKISIPPNGLVSFSGDGPVVELIGLSQALRPAQNLQLTLVFANAGSVQLTVAVSAPDGQVSLAPTVTSAGDGESEG